MVSWEGDVEFSDICAVCNAQTQLENIYIYLLLLIHVEEEHSF